MRVIEKSGDSTVLYPYAIKVLLHYYAIPEDHPDISRDPPIWNDTIGLLFREDLLTKAPALQDALMYEITDRGRAYCEALQQMPLPVQAWVMPS